MPKFNGNLEYYLTMSLRYPKLAWKKKIEGKVLVQFVIDKSGRTRSVKPIRSAGSKLLDEEGMRLIRAMPDWFPGKKEGSAVSAICNLPITFKL